MQSKELTTPRELYRQLVGIREQIKTEKNRLAQAFAACDRLAGQIAELAKPTTGTIEIK